MPYNVSIAATNDAGIGELTAFIYFTQELGMAVIIIGRIGQKLFGLCFSSYVVHLCKCIGGETQCQVPMQVLFLQHVCVS